MLTTTLMEPKALPLIMPADGDHTPVAVSKSMTLLVRADKTISWYEGTGDDPLICLRYSTALSPFPMVSAK